MTPEELRAKYPEVVAQIEAAAKEAASAAIIRELNTAGKK